MPNITVTEAAVVVAALMCLYVAPALLAWSGQRRRRLQHVMPHDTSAPPMEEPRSSAEVVSVPPEVADMALPSETVLAPPAAAMLPVEQGAAEPEAQAAPAPPVAAATARAETIVAQGTPMIDVTRAASVVPVILNGTASIVVRPIEGLGRHHFKLDELRQARLPDCPPAVVRDDPQRAQAWSDAERVIAALRDVIGGATISSPYPALSTCLGAAERAGSLLRMQFLLFPVLWPASRNEAAASVVFEVDDERGALRAWVDLPPSESASSSAS